MIERTWRAIKATGMWYVLNSFDGQLYEAWVWDGTDEPPKTMFQENFRWQLTGE